MKNSRILPAILYCLMTVSATIAAQDESRQINSIIPKPSKMQTYPGQFTLNDSTTIVCDFASKQMMHTAEYLADRLRAATGYKFRITDAKHPRKSNYISFQT